MTLAQITDEEIEEARVVLAHHTPDPLTPEGAVECLYWCIASQAATWEQTSRFVYNLRKASHLGIPPSQAVKRYATKSILENSMLIRRTAKASGMRFDDRFEYVASILNPERWRNPEWLQEVIEADESLREEYVKGVKWLGRKTFSFWSLCLGGKNLIALDVHVMRQLRDNFGVVMHDSYITPQARSKGSQKVRRTPGKKDYLRIEQETRDIFSQDRRFVERGRVDLGLVDAVLWWRGANRGTLRQRSLFGVSDQISKFMPYADIQIPKITQ